MEAISLKYGQKSVELYAENAKSVTYLRENKMPAIADVKADFINSLTSDTINSKPLNELIENGDKITIVVSDITRLWMRQDILCSYLTEFLHEELGIKFDDITVVVALGTHRKNSAEELKKIAGEYAYNNVSVVDHDCDAPDLVTVGTTSFGTKVVVNPLIVGRKVIVIGGTVHHLMAGYGGGRKSILPGLASRETIGMNHIMALDPDKAMSSVKVGSGKMLENPINLDMREAADMIDVTFGISVVMDTHAKHSGFFCGDFVKAWEQSCRYVQQSYAVPIEQEADIVIASCGGFPKDINLYQSTKTLFNAVRAVKKEGILILIAECTEGGGAPDFFAWQKPLANGTLDKDLRENFTIGGYIFYAACENARKAKSYLLSEIDPALVTDMGIEAHNSIEDIMNKVDFKDKTVYVMEYGGSLVPQISQDFDNLNKEI